MSCGYVAKEGTHLLRKPVVTSIVEAFEGIMYYLLHCIQFLFAHSVWLSDFVGCAAIL